MKDGFTLIELMVAMGIGLIMLAFVSSYTVGNLRVGTDLKASQTLRSNMVMSNQLMFSRLREACQTYPNGTLITLADTPGAKNGTSLDWTVGDDPFVAVIIPTGTTPKFIAYYLISRSEYRAQATDAQQIPAGPAGDTSLVLMEYSVPLASGACDNPPTSLPTAEATALMVADQVRAPVTAEDPFDVGSDQAVEYKLRFAQRVPGREVVYPPLSQDPMHATIVGRNVR